MVVKIVDHHIKVSRSKFYPLLRGVLLLKDLARIQETLLISILSNKCIFNNNQKLKTINSKIICSFQSHLSKCHKNIIKKKNYLQKIY